MTNEMQSAVGDPPNWAMEAAELINKAAYLVEDRSEDGTKKYSLEFEGYDSNVIAIARIIAAAVPDEGAKDELEWYGRNFHGWCWKVGDTVHYNTMVWRIAEPERPLSAAGRWVKVQIVERGATP